MKILITLLAGVALILCGCATPTATVTGSFASGRLLSDTTRMVLMVDSARMPDCKERRQITVTPLVSDKPGTIVERWRVERCGETKFYRITYTPTPATGGTDFGVQEER
jgi:hypothetical protein